MIVETVSNSFNNFVDNRGSGGGYFLSIILVTGEAPSLNKIWWLWRQRGRQTNLVSMEPNQPKISLLSKYIYYRRAGLSGL